MSHKMLFLNQESTFHPLLTQLPHFMRVGNVLTKRGILPPHTTCDTKILRRYFKRCKEPRNRFQGIDFASLGSLAGRYDNPIPIWYQ
jgi:hypothetical protein